MKKKKDYVRGTHLLKTKIRMYYKNVGNSGKNWMSFSTGLKEFG